MGITEVVTVGIDKQGIEQQGNDEDPRKQRSRSRLLDAATTLLAEGGVDAVTIDAVTKLANVARATLYRHFDSGTELLAAAFARLLPPVPEMSGEGDLRAQLLELLTSQAKAIESAPIQVTAMCWLGLGPELKGYSSVDALSADKPELRSLRQTVFEAVPTRVRSDPALAGRDRRVGGVRLRRRTCSVGRTFGAHQAGHADASRGGCV